MKKGFTLIELLAVIVILAIIALIATPIVLSIIEDSKSNANLRSAENYLTAAKQSITNHQMNNPDQSVSGVYKVMKNGNLCKGTIDNDKCNGIEIRVQVSGEKIMPSEITIGEDGDLTKAVGVKINGKDYVYTNGKFEQLTTICELSEGTSKTIGSKYTCHLDSDRTFYVLEVTDDNISLIMDQNIGDTVAWISNEDFAKLNPTRYQELQTSYGCQNYGYCSENIYGPITANKYLQEQTKNWNVVVSIPTYDQIYRAAGNKAMDLPNWLYGNLSNSKPDGYWTISPYTSSSEVWHVYYNGYVLSSHVAVSNASGVRPVITISKSQLD